MEIYLFRHGETEYNRSGIIQGSGVDLSLNSAGRQQRALFHRHYGHLAFDLVISSTLKRSMETVAPFVEEGVSWVRMKEINEIHWGIHEGRPSQPWMIEAYRKMIAAWHQGDFDARLEEGESARELATRLERFLDFLVARPERRILICSHGRTMRCLLCLMEGQHLREMEQFEHHNTGLYRILYKDGIFRITLRNNTDHLNETIVHRHR